MAGISWIKVETTLPRKPVVYQVAMALGVDDLTVIGALISLLCWADGVTADGTIGKGGDVIIDRVCGLKGLSDALIDAGWLTKDADGVVAFAEWERHNGANAKKRAMTARRVEKMRNATVTHNALHEGTNCNTDVTQVLRSERKLDKIRIDKNNNNTHVSIISGGSETFMPDDNGSHAFLETYGKKPRNTRAFRLAWAEALREVKDAATLTKAAEIFIDHMRVTEGSTRFLPTPEVWLKDCKYRDTIKQAKQATTSQSVRGRLADLLPEGFEFKESN